MKLKIHDVSTICRLTFHKGKPCDKYEMNLFFVLPARNGGRKKATIRLIRDTQEELERIIEKSDGFFEFKKKDLQHWHSWR